MKILSPLALLLSTLLSAGCGNMLKSDYHPPQINYPANWHQDENTSTQIPFDWRDFHDPELERWVYQVMASNNDLAGAALRVYRARLEAEQVGITGDPGLRATLNSGGGNELSRSSSWTKNSSTSLNTSFEVDLWGKIARQRDAAEWASQATEEDLRAARLTLLSDASKNYWRIGFINQQIDVLQQSITYAKETLRLANARHRAGGISLLDVVDSEQSLLVQENRLIALKRDRLQALNEQAVLLGAPPGSSMIEPSRLPAGTLPKIRADIPASVLSRRPDISAKEWRVRQALANVDIKRTAYYPAFSLTGSLGTTSTALLAFLNNPVGTVGASFSLPFLEWRQMDVNIKIARNDYEQRVLEFKQALYKAMTGIDDALSQRAQLLAQESHLHAALELSRRSERLNEVRYRQGAVSITFWLDAQEKRRQAELALDENRYGQYQNLAQIYLEFGGSQQ